MEKREYDVIERAYKSAVAVAQEIFMERLANEGIVCDGLVREKRTGAVYEITMMTFRASPGYLYGRKKRKDGTFGTFVHPIGAPDDVDAVGGE